MDKGAKAAQLADQIRDYLAAWIRKDFPGCLVSVAQVQLSTNLQQATVWLEVFGDDQGSILPKVRKYQAEYQRRLYQNLRRFAIPTIHFELSTAYEDAARIDELLNSDKI
jgi:ribosome-binding factor A